MSAVEVVPVALKRGPLKKFVKFGISLYKGNDCYVPPLVFDEVETFLPSKNPAFAFCEAQPFMAYRDGKPVGRIVAIINNRLNCQTGVKQARFGWVEFVDDDEVVDALFAAAEEWAKSKGMTEIVGPMGFSDMDHEGMLTFGFDELGTIATIYNHPYYPVQVERMGYMPDAEWVEYRMTVPDAVPDKYQRIAAIVAQKYNLRALKFTSRKKIKEQYGVALFELINEAYADLYGYCPLTPEQIEYYIDKYLGIIRLDCVSVIVDECDKLVALGISMPSLSRALQKSGGKLFPMGWWHMLRDINGPNKIVDLMLIAVKKEYLSRGVNAMIFADLLPIYIKHGFEYAESNLELENNENVQKQWQYFERRLHRRRRAYRKSL